MPFPKHLKPLPTIISNPAEYFNVIQMMQTVEQCNHLKLEFSQEMGVSERFYQLVLYVSQNIIDVRLEMFDGMSEQKKREKRSDTEKFVNGVIALNPLEKHAHLKALYKDMKPLQRERVSLL